MASSWSVANRSCPPPEHFTPHLGEYVNVLSALEKLNVAILKAMDKTKEVGGPGFHLCWITRTETSYNKSNAKAFKTFVSIRHTSKRSELFLLVARLSVWNLVGGPFEISLPSRRYRRKRKLPSVSDSACCLLSCLSSLTVHFQTTPQRLLTKGAVLLKTAPPARQQVGKHGSSL